jgi:hypothetical protein
MGEGITDPIKLGPENNWGWMGPFARNASLAMPGGGLFGAHSQQTAADMALGDWAARSGMTPSYLDHLTRGIFDSSGLYDKTAEIMDNWNLAGRSGLLGDPRSLLGQSPLMDYTYKYGDWQDDVEPYSPDLSTASGQAVAQAKLYTTKTPITAADMLNDKVLPFYEQHIHDALAPLRSNDFLT